MFLLPSAAPASHLTPPYYGQQVPDLLWPCFLCALIFLGPLFRHWLELGCVCQLPCRLVI